MTLRDGVEKKSERIQYKAGTAYKSLALRMRVAVEPVIPNVISHVWAGVAQNVQIRSEPIPHVEAWGAGEAQTVQI